MSVAVKSINGSSSGQPLDAGFDESQLSQLNQMFQQIEAPLKQMLREMSEILREISVNTKSGITPRPDLGVPMTGKASTGSTPSFAHPSELASTSPSDGAPTKTPESFDKNVSTNTDSSLVERDHGDVSGITNNAGGVPQASAINGVNPNSATTVNTGTGNDKTFNVTNDTSRAESLTYSVQGQNKGTITLNPGQTGTFTAGSGDIGVRISPSDKDGNTKPNEILYEDGGAGNGQAAGAGNPDISKVDGDKDYAGDSMNMAAMLSDGRSAGDGNTIRPYMYPTDDASAMGLAGDSSKTVNIVMSDTSASH